MSWRLAKSLVRLREQINAAYPGRDKTSDGSIGDAKHKSRRSDHNPHIEYKGQGIVTAIDIDEDVDQTGTVEPIIKAIQASLDPRVKYIIYEGRITIKGDIQRWKKYSGVNPHRQHAHISVRSDPKLFDDTRDWSIGPDTDPAPPSAPAHTAVRPLIKRGSLEPESITFIQRRLMITADGHFGPQTESAVKAFQKQKGLPPDGIVGPATWKALLA